MKLKAFGATEQRIYNAVKPIADEFGFQIWDVRFEKEGACWYLRIFIDQESGITIEDCEKMTEPVNKLLDEQDPISQNYILEVGSAGLEREFNRTWHFTDGIGTEVRARTIRPIDGEREFIGTLQSCKDDMLTLETETGSINLGNKNRVQLLRANLHRLIRPSISLPLAALTFVKRYEAFEF